MAGAPRSKEFDDVYFSDADGLAETRHVFLEGNGLPGAWAGRKRFVIAETGLGTGLNFLAAWKCFRENSTTPTLPPHVGGARTGGGLHYISFEKYPLRPEEIREYLKPWENEFTHELSRLLEIYPMRIPGFHRVMVEEGVHLTLIFDDVNKALPELEAQVDCWFLDGFKPASNPDMWSETVFRNMARLSAPGATFATFTAAGAVKRGLAAAGFEVNKVKGFGKKRDMLAGRFK